MDEYVCVTVMGEEGESEASVKSRLSAFWSLMLREAPAEFEKVYAEEVAFEREGGCLTRKYLVEAVVAESLVARLTLKGLKHLPVDPDDLYTKYEAAPPDWFWIEH